MAYATASQIEKILGRTLKADETARLSGLQVIVDNWINHATGLSFGTDTSSRYYDGGSEVISIDPVRNITAVEQVDENLGTVISYVSNQDYVAEPLNETVKTYLVKRVAVDNEFFWGDTHGWYPGTKNIKVTGKFSYADTVPADISELAAYLAAKVYSTPVEGKIKSESLEGYSRTYASSIAEINQLVQDDTLVSMVLSNYDGQEIFF